MSFQDPPTDFNIQATQSPDVVKYTWSALERHPLQWMPLVFGILMLVQAVAMPILFFTNTPNDLDTIPLVIACLFLGTIGSTLAWSGYRKRGHEVVELRRGSMTYDSGPTVMPRPVLLFFCIPHLFNSFLAAGYSAPTTHFRRQQRTFPRNSIGTVTLERVGGRQRLRFDFGRDRVEIGYLLTEPEREWLHRKLVAWQQSDENLDI